MNYVMIFFGLLYLIFYEFYVKMFEHIFTHSIDNITYSRTALCFIFCETNT